MMLTAFGEELLSLFWEIVKIASAYGVAKIIFLIYAYKKKWLMFSE